MIFLKNLVATTNINAMPSLRKQKKSLDLGKFTCGIFVDLQKAFDTVNHEILLNKLEIMVFVVHLMHGLNPI